MRRRSLLPFSAIVIMLAALAVSEPAIGQASDLEPRQLRVVWSTDPAHHATVSWTTTAPGTRNVVHFDVQSRGGIAADYMVTADAVVTGEYQSSGPYFHHASLGGLEPNTDVYFTAETDGNVSGELYFRTAPTGDDPVNLLYGGDSRTGRSDRQKMNRLIGRLHDEDPEILALIHGGDYIAYANSWSQWAGWLDDYELTTATDGRVLPIVPAKGNHEGLGVLYNRVFGEPSGDPEKNWFYTRFGSLALINLDTEASLAGEQRDWLRERLIEGRDARWLIVNYHRPAFPAVKSPSGAREHWVPLFEEFDVDLVCESDGHTLKRTPPIRNEQVDFTGVTYVGEGGLGVPQRTPLLDRWYLQSPGMATSAHHVQRLELTPDLLRYQAVLSDGTVADEVTILPRDQRLAQQITAIEARAPDAHHVEVMLSKPFDPVTAIENEWEIEPSVAVQDVRIGAEVGAVLALVNQATQAELDDDIGLDARAARNIIAFRAGDDGALGTSDDLEFETWAELDAVSYVGDSALARLSDAALADAPNEHNVITLRVGELAPGTPYRVDVPEVEDRAGAAVAPGTTVSFVFTPPDDRADAIASPDEGPAADGGCSTSPAAGRSPIWMLALAALFVGWRRR